MLSPKEKAKELVNKFKDFADESYEDKQNPYYGQVLAKRREVLNYSAKQCALIAVENEYNALREQLFNLRSYKVIENEKVYLIRLQQLIDEEKEVKQELEKL